MKSMMKSLGGLALGLALALGVSALLGENPLTILSTIALATFGSHYDFSVTLFYMSPLLFTGLSVALAFHCGLFNIGAEGQLTVGALAATLVGVLIPLESPWLAIPLSLGAALLAGGGWAALAAWAKLRRGAHEVISTIMLNFIAMALAGWVVSQGIPSTTTQNPQTQNILPAYFFSAWDPIKLGIPNTPLSLGIVLGVFVALGLDHFLYRTRGGLQLRAAGLNARAARLSGISSERVLFTGFAAAGALAGLVAVPEILGNSGNFQLGFSPGYGFLGIAVSLMARNRPLGILLSSFLFATLHKGALNLDLETEYITRDFSLLIQSFMILFVSAQGLWRRRGTRAMDR